MVIVVGDRAFGDWLRWFRQAAGMAQKELATAADISRQSIVKWEGNVRLPRRPDDIDRLAEALGLDDLQTEILRVTAGHSKRRAREIEKEIASRSPTSLPPASKGKLESEQQIEPLNRLQALLSDFSATRVRSLIADFVGRNNELGEIGLQIDALVPKGGYLVITGLAGLGKSSIIAKLVEAQGLERSAYHFIPVNPPADHVVHLLLDVMARLILKHNLPNWYVADTSLPMLRNSFAMLLRQIAAKGKREVIFIDGLDQLREDRDGERDLRFLPNDPPEGIVFVLGTRPDSTLDSLELYKPLIRYELPQLSRSDFEILLKSHNVTLNLLLADKFYHLMQGNSLYLSQLAKELAYKDGAAPEAIIEQITDNPENLFSLSMDRLGRKRDTRLWNEVIKPILGVLLVAREPLARNHLRLIIGVDADRFNQGVRRLQGLLADDGQQRYTLFHLKFRDYLREDAFRPHKDYIFAADEVQAWHKRLSAWCEYGGIKSIWQEVKSDPIERGRRLYARHHYISHLYLAHEWQRLFEVLDAGEYGRAKIQADRSMHSYAQDLDLGRQATTWDGWTLEEGISLLPRLWRYTLLRCSLVSQVDRYPPGAFEILVHFKREREALDLAELVSDPVEKVRVLLRIAKLIEGQSDKQAIHFQIYLRACEVVRSIPDEHKRGMVIEELGNALVQWQQREQVEVLWNEVAALAETIQELSERLQLHCELAVALARTSQLEQAHALLSKVEEHIQRIQDDVARFTTFCMLGTSFAKLQQQGQAELAWLQAEVILSKLQGRPRPLVWALCHLGEAFLETHQPERAKPFLYQALSAIFGFRSNIEQEYHYGDSDNLEATVRWVGQAFIKAQMWEMTMDLFPPESDVGEEVTTALGIAAAQAHNWEVAEKVLHMGLEREDKESVLYVLSVALLEDQRWEQAKDAIWTIQGGELWFKALGELGAAQARHQQWERAEVTWSRIEEIVHRNQIDSYLKGAKAEGICALGVALARTRQWEQAEALWNKVDKVPIGQTESSKPTETGWVKYKVEKNFLDVFQSYEVQQALGIVCAQSQQWERVEAILHELDHYSAREEVQCALGVALAQSRQWERAEAVIQTLKEKSMKIKVLSALAMALTKAQGEQRAEAMWAKAEALAWEIRREGRECLNYELTETGRLRHAMTESIHGTEGVEALCTLGTALTQVGQGERAEAVWAEAESLARTVKVDDEEKSIEFIQAWMSEQYQPFNFGYEQIKQHYAEALCTLGAALAQVQQWKRAEVLWEEAEMNIQGLNEGNWSARQEALGALGVALAQARQWKRAEAVIREIPPDKIGDNREKSLCKVAEIMSMRGEQKQLLQLVQSWWQQATSREEAIHLLPLVAGLLHFKPAVGLACCEAFKWVDALLNNQGNMVNQSRWFEQVLEDYNRVIKLNPKDPNAYLKRSNLYENFEQYEQALEDCNRAIELNPKEANAYFHRASIYESLKKYEQAIEDCNRAIELNITFADAFAMRGVVYLRLDEFKRAIQDCDQAIKLNPNIDYAFYIRGLAHLWMRDVNNALDSFSRRWNLNQTNMKVAYLIAWVRMGKERSGLEIAHQLQSDALYNPQDYGAFVCRGIALGLQERLEEGLTELERAISLEPDVPGAYFWKGILSAYQGHYQKSTESMEKSLTVGLPPILLIPLYWLKKDRPDFFEKHACSLLEQYGV